MYNSILNAQIYAAPLVAQYQLSTNPLLVNQAINRIMNNSEDSSDSDSRKDTDGDGVHDLVGMVKTLISEGQEMSTVDFLAQRSVISSRSRAKGYLTERFKLKQEEIDGLLDDNTTSYTDLVANLAAKTGASQFDINVILHKLFGGDYSAGLGDEIKFSQAKEALAEQLGIKPDDLDKFMFRMENNDIIKFIEKTSRITGLSKPEISKLIQEINRKYEHSLAKSFHHDEMRVFQLIADKVGFPISQMNTMIVEMKNYDMNTFLKDLSQQSGKKTYEIQAIIDKINLEYCQILSGLFVKKTGLTGSEILAGKFGLRNEELLYMLMKSNYDVPKFMKLLSGATKQELKVISRQMVAIDAFHSGVISEMFVLGHSGRAIFQEI